MRFVLTILAGLLAIGALVASIVSGESSVAEVWFSVDSNSLVGFGALIEKNIDPDLWLNVFLPVLTTSLWLFLAVLAVVVLLVRWAFTRK